MHAGDIQIVEIPCRRCGTSLRQLSQSLVGADDLRQKLGGICGGCITPEEERQITLAVLGALVEMESAVRH